jgi:hypothetical protein
VELKVEVSKPDLSDIVETRGYGDDHHPVTLGDLVVEAMVRQLAADPRTTELRSRIRELRDAVIRENLVPLIAEALAGPWQKTFTWGEPSGEPVALRDIVIEEAQKVLQGSQRDRAYERNEPLIVQLVRKEVDQVLRKDMTEAIRGELEKVTAAVRTKAASVIADSLAAGLSQK